MVRVILVGRLLTASRHLCLCSVKFRKRRAMRRAATLTPLIAPVGPWEAPDGPQWVRIAVFHLFESLAETEIFRQTVPRGAMRLTVRWFPGSSPFVVNRLTCLDS